MPDYPPDLQAVSGQLAANEKAVDELVGSLTPDQLSRRRTDGGWSILQCLEHLTLANRIYCDPVRRALTRKPLPRRSPLRTNPLGRLFLKSLEPPVARKTRSPHKIAPAAGGSHHEILAAFHESHREIGELIDQAQGLDLNAIKFRNPFMPLIRMRAGTALLILAAHERRHLWQAAQLKAAILKAR